MIRTLFLLSFGTSFVAICYAYDIECYLGSVSSSNFLTSSLTTVKCDASSSVQHIAELKGKLPARKGSSENFTRINYCMIYSPDTKGDTDSNATVNFSCDFDNACVDVASPIKITGGTIYCCNSSLCNSPSVVELKMPSLQCYTGSVNKKNASVKGTYCNTQYCKSVKYYEADDNAAPEKSIKYKCDEEGQCLSGNINTGCKNVTDGGAKVEVCCCTASNCNKPTYVISNDKPLSTLPPEIHTDTAHSNWMYIGGVLSATVVAVLVVVGLIIVIRKCQQRKDEHVRYIYSQLTADLSEELDDDDAYMIVA